MTLELLKSRLPYMNALVEGKRVQWRWKSGDVWKWATVPSDPPSSFVNWDNIDLEFRMQPEVREWWIRSNSFGSWDASLEKPVMHHSMGWIHVREVGE